MSWEPHVRKHTRKGRRPWYTIQTGGQEHHLGTDRSAAYRKAAKLLEGTSAGLAPQTVPGLILLWASSTGKPSWGPRRWGNWRPEQRLDELEPSDLQAYADFLSTAASERSKDDAALKPWTIRKYVQSARTVWLWGHERKFVPCEPKARIKTKKPINHPRDISVEAAKAAIGRLNPRARAIATFIATTGCRPSEARSLRWSDVNFQRSMVLKGESKTSGATGRVRTFPIPEAAMLVVIDQLRINEWVFNTIRKRPWTKDGLHIVMGRAGIVNVYSLRHMYAQWYLDHGGPGGRPGDKAELQELLGHQDGRMTDIYAQVRPRRLQRIGRRIKGPLGD